MSIAPYLRIIGRGKDGARALSYDQARDLMAHILDGRCGDLEIGAFCIAMRVKGETVAELSGFLDAVQERIHLIPASSQPVLVLPSYNGARKLPLLTPLLAILLAQAGHPVLIHGAQTETSRITCSQVLAALKMPSSRSNEAVAPGEIRYLPLQQLLPALEQLLMARLQIGLRNSGHSLVKLLNPVAGPAVVVSSYTHPEYLNTLQQTLCSRGATAMLLRGTEGEPVADGRRLPRLDVVCNGVLQTAAEQQSGSLTQLPELPSTTDPVATADYIAQVVAGTLPVPPPIRRQVQELSQLAEKLGPIACAKA